MCEHLNKAPCLVKLKNLCRTQRKDKLVTIQVSQTCEFDSSKYILVDELDLVTQLMS